MKIFYFLLFVFAFALEVSAQTEPPLPTVCFNNGPNPKNNLTVIGNTTFTFSNLAEFDASESSNNITVTVESSQKYRLYIAGVMTALTGSASNTQIPVNTFTIASTNRGTAPALVTLSNSYLEVANFGSSTNGLSHTLTITRNMLNTYQQEPGSHTLTLHIRYCQY